MAFCIFNSSGMRQSTYILGLVETLGSSGVSLQVSSGSEPCTENHHGRLDLAIRKARIQVPL